MGGSGFRDRTLPIKKEKKCLKIGLKKKKSHFFHISSSYAKYWGKQIFTHGIWPAPFSHTGDSLKLVKSRRRKGKRILQGLRVAQAAVTKRGSFPEVGQK